MLFHHLCWFHFWPDLSLFSCEKPNNPFFVSLSQSSMAALKRAHWSIRGYSVQLLWRRLPFKCSPQSLFLKGLASPPTTYHMINRLDISEELLSVSKLPNRLAWIYTSADSWHSLVTIFKRGLSRCLWGEQSLRNIGWTQGGRSINGACWICNIYLYISILKGSLRGTQTWEVAL